MAESRKRRLVGRILIWMVLLVAGYFGSYLCMLWAFHNGHSMYAEPVLVHARPFWRPIEMYEESALPLGRDLMTLEIWLCRNGGSWSRAQADAAIQMRMRKKWREVKARIQESQEIDISG